MDEKPNATYKHDNGITVEIYGEQPKREVLESALQDFFRAIIKEGYKI